MSRLLNRGLRASDLPSLSALGYSGCIPPSGAATIRSRLFGGISTEPKLFDVVHEKAHRILSFTPIERRHGLNLHNRSGDLKRSYFVHTKRTCLIWPSGRTRPVRNTGWNHGSQRGYERNNSPTFMTPRLFGLCFKPGAVPLGDISLFPIKRPCRFFPSKQNPLCTFQPTFSLDGIGPTM